MGNQMASRPEAFKIEVKFQPRDDGGLIASCDAIPAFYLSSSAPERVLADIEPALTVILSEMYGVQMRVTRLPTFPATEAEPVMPAHLCGSQEYVGLTTRH